ncbi:hypothetical protein [Aquimarina sp. SS2-1]|uniref:hypothetical protein n=1 Tax=Aquimarina besae TaxID=3342247 RepID=UPI003671E9BD
MIKKGVKVQWSQGNSTLSGIVEETYKYKITRKTKENPFVSYSNASMALYIRTSDGSHILKNDSDVYL